MNNVTDLFLIQEVIFNVPVPIFWKDINGKFLGGNKLFLDVLGLKTIDDLIGKSDIDFPSRDSAKQYYADDEYVIKTGKQIKRVENIQLSNRIIISETTKAPLIKDNKIIGILGIILDITDRIEREYLELKTQSHQIERQQQEKFKKIVERVVHDVGSPLGAISMMIPSFNVVPEKARLNLLNAINRIRDILTNLWDEFLFKDNDIGSDSQTLNNQYSSLVLACKPILEIINEKKYECDFTINIIPQITTDGNFVFIDVDVKAFKRMLSNIINNSINALESVVFKKIIVHLYVVANNVKIIIEDNGVGMSKNLIQKILSNDKIFSGKRNGYAIGFEQIKDTLLANNGQLSIESTPNVGTQVILTFPKIDTPYWIYEKIILHKNDIVIILDDDEFIYEYWNIKFSAALKSDHNIAIRYFQSGEETIKFINSLSEEERARLLFFTDYELINQNLNGIDVVLQLNITEVTRIKLVTNHYIGGELLKKICNLNIQVIPKELVNIITVELCNQVHVA